MFYFNFQTTLLSPETHSAEYLDNNNTVSVDLWHLVGLATQPDSIGLPLSTFKYSASVNT